MAAASSSTPSEPVSSIRLLRESMAAANLASSAATSAASAIEWFYGLRNANFCILHNTQSGPPSRRRAPCVLVALPETYQNIFMSVTNVRHKVILDGAEFSSPSSNISISSHRTRPLEVEVTRATRCRRTPPPPPSSPAASPRRRHIARHRRTPNHSQGWVIGILSLFLSYLWMTSTSAAETRFILDIAKSFCIMIF